MRNEGSTLLARPERSSTVPVLHRPAGRPASIVPQRTPDRAGSHKIALLVCYPLQVPLELHREQKQSAGSTARHSVSGYETGCRSGGDGGSRTPVQKSKPKASTS